MMLFTRSRKDPRGNHKYTRAQPFTSRGHAHTLATVSPTRDTDSDQPRATRASARRRTPPRGNLYLVVSPRREARARRSARHTRVHVAHTRAADPHSRVAWRLCTPTCEPPRSRAPTRHGHTRVVSSHQMLTSSAKAALLTPHITSHKTSNRIAQTRAEAACRAPIMHNAPVVLDGKQLGPPKRSRPRRSNRTWYRHERRAAHATRYS